MPTAPTTAPLPPWHAGEVALQQSVGVAERMALHGRRIFRDQLPEQHRAFYPRLPYLLAGAVDPQGAVWATVLAGAPGFARSPDPGTLHIATPRNPADPADAGMEDGHSIALLGIELSTRRRNRLNGVIRRSRADAFDVSVEQAYGNCPQYIQLRDFELVRDPSVPPPEPARTLGHFDAHARAMITEADTFFVATYVDREGGHRQVDVSHRGGRPGFVRLGDDGVLTIPDFSGNQFFNTLGNILVNPKAGIVFIDFETGDVLQISGDAEVVLDSEEIAAFEGAERLWRLTPRKTIYRAGALPLRWTFEPDGWSPEALATGSWPAILHQAGSNS
ncbi:MAG TPA: pyridoxamine 5'-phosphate oxidase family protein [Steroidobacteraceae bacterium]|nr:pyridoxamine 5'-phosphate oxidase family protein [Steroidobacteraceae bacterium]